ncbi:hypothetical protein BC943DRAFT_332032 [Umbelopsis sp. AD052]|nr:hypothetical protein BC943DRAFT_332032 [Umbelopsis sp. AD052]
MLATTSKAPGTPMPKRNGAIDDEKYRQRYKELKKRIRDIEEDNDILHVRLHKARKNIGRLRLERSFLLERIERVHERSDIDSDESDGMSDALSHDGLDFHHPQHMSRKPVMRIFEKPQRRKKDPNAPKGPGNVFFLYCRLERDKIKDEFPNENLGDVTKLLGQKWKSLSKDGKQKYYDLYRKEQEEYEVAMKTYNKEATSFMRDPIPSISRSSPGPIDGGAYSDRAHAADMALTSSQQGSSIIDEEEDLLDADPQPRTSHHDMDADTDELLDDEDFQVYPTTNFSSKEQAHKWQQQQNARYQSIK